MDYSEERIVNAASNAFLSGVGLIILSLKNSKRRISHASE
jgi:hypothetical protein